MVSSAICMRFGVGALFSECQALVLVLPASCHVRVGVAVWVEFKIEWPGEWCVSCLLYTSWVQMGCKGATIGCIECKGPVIEGVLKELKPIQERAAQYAEDPTLVKNIVAEGCEKARKLARETMRDVRDAMGLSYS